LASRTEQRRAAVWALYQSDLLDRPLEFDQDTHTFAIGLAEAVRENQDELDLLIRRYSKGWTLNRIAPLERSILRVALLEITKLAIRRFRLRAPSMRRWRPPRSSAALTHPNSSTACWRLHCAKCNPNLPKPHSVL
jgi:hypothetical protein